MPFVVGGPGVVGKSATKRLPDNKPSGIPDKKKPHNANADAPEVSYFLFSVLHWCNGWKNNQGGETDSLLPAYC